MSSGPQRVTIISGHSWIRHMENHISNQVNHGGVISGTPITRVRLVIGPTLLYMPAPRTVTVSASFVQDDLTII